MAITRFDCLGDVASNGCNYAMSISWKLCGNVQDLTSRSTTHDDVDHDSRGEITKKDVIKERFFGDESRFIIYRARAVRESNGRTE